MSLSPISYATALYPVRDDFAAAHNRYWQRLAKPGAWLKRLFFKYVVLRNGISELYRQRINGS